MKGIANMRMIFPAVGAIVAVIVLPPAATAQQSDEQRQCFAREGVSPEQRLAACTALIDSGGATPQSLVGALISRGNIYLRKRDYGGAIHDYDWAIEQTMQIDPNWASPNLAVTFYNRGLAYQGMARHDRAIVDFSQALWLNPNDAATYVSRGYSYGAKRDYDRAIQDFDQAIQIDRSFAAAFSNRARAYQRKGQNDLAIEDLDQAIRLNPDDADAFMRRADIRRVAGQYDRAVADYRKALALKVDDGTKRQIELSLQQLGAAP